MREPVSCIRVNRKGDESGDEKDLLPDILSGLMAGDSASARATDTVGC